MTIGIYKIHNIINDKVYVGQSANIEKRWLRHTQLAFSKKHKSYNYPLYNSIRKYGITNFVFEIIEKCKHEDLNNREIYWIKELDSVNNGYNSTNGGQNVCYKSLNDTKLKQITIDLKNAILTDLEISEKYSISRRLVNDINKGRCWRRDINYPIRDGKKTINRKLVNEESLRHICIECGVEITGKCYCRKCFIKKARANIPKSEELIKALNGGNFKQVASAYGVSDNAVRKWCSIYGLSIKSKDYKNKINITLRGETSYDKFSNNA